MLITRALIFYFLIFTSSLAASAESLVNQLVAAEVEPFIQLSDYPAFKGSGEYFYFRENCHDPILLLPEDVIAPLQSVFDQLQEHNFGSSIFRILLGPADIMVNDNTTRTIYVDPRFITPLIRSLSGEKRDAVLAVMLGHEMGHYLYEQILLASPTKATALGNKSWKTTKNFELAHGEVDVIGFNLAERAGFKVELARNIFEEVDAALQKGDGVVRYMSPHPERQSIIDAYLSPLN